MSLKRWCQCVPIIVKAAGQGAETVSSGHCTTTQCKVLTDHSPEGAEQPAADAVLFRPTQLIRQDGQILYTMWDTTVSTQQVPRYSAARWPIALVLLPERMGTVAVQLKCIVVPAWCRSTRSLMRPWDIHSAVPRRASILANGRKYLGR